MINSSAGAASKPRIASCQLMIEIITVMMPIAKIDAASGIMPSSSTAGMTAVSNRTRKVESAEPFLS